MRNFHNRNPAFEPRKSHRLSSAGGWLTAIAPLEEQEQEQEQEQGQEQEQELELELELKLKLMLLRECR